MRTTLVLLTLGLAGCPRVEARIVTEEPGGCRGDGCGGWVAVKTSLAVGTPLTPEECQSVCASKWCDAPPIAADMRCWLNDPQNVLCGATAYDCGQTLGSTCNASNCAGCCRDGDGSCDSSPAALACGGARCTVCKPDAGLPEMRCSPGNCSALRACGAELRGQPRLETCGVDAGFDPLRYCPEVCLAEGAGELLSCASSIAAQCADAGAGALALLTSTCGTTADGGIDLSCLAACDTVRAGCDQRCKSSGTSLESCMNCASACGLEWARCAVTCR